MGKFRLRITGDLGFEFWKDIEGFEGLYQVSTYGRVRSCDRLVNHPHNSTALKRGKILKPLVDKNGYYFCQLLKNRNNKRIHRLVALAFIPNFYKLEYVNHKDENKTNNRVENLEWCDAQYNTNYGTANVRRGITEGKKTLQYSKSGILIKEWYSTCEACRKLHISQGHISSCCLGKRKSAGGYIWKYKKEE